LNLEVLSLISLIRISPPPVQYRIPSGREGGPTSLSRPMETAGYPTLEVVDKILDEGGGITLNLSCHGKMNIRAVSAWVVP